MTKAASGLSKKNAYFNRWLQNLHQRRTRLWLVRSRVIDGGERGCGVDSRSGALRGPKPAHTAAPCPVPFSFTWSLAYKHIKQLQRTAVRSLCEGGDVPASGINKVSGWCEGGPQSKPENRVFQLDIATIYILPNLTLCRFSTVYMLIFNSPIGRRRRRRKKWLWLKRAGRHAGLLGWWTRWEAFFM